MAQDILLYGTQTLTPFTFTTYNLIADPKGTNLDSNNEVRLLINTSVAGCELYLPPISSFGGKWNLLLYLIDSANAWGSNSVNLLTGGFDYISYPYGYYTNLTLSNSGAVAQLAIAGPNKWYWPSY